MHQTKGWPMKSSKAINSGMGMLLGAFALSPVENAQAEVWDDQTERLQVVNAALLDGAPAIFPFTSQKYHLGLNVDLSILPKVNPKVGTKKESVPQPPVHAVPKIAAGACVLSWGSSCLGAQIWAGYLPSAFSKVGGLKNGTFTQNLMGVGLPLSVQVPFMQKPWRLTLRPWYQMGESELESKISSKEADDTFKVKSSLRGIDFGVGYVEYKLTGVFTFYSRDIDSEFYIVEDNNTIKIKDEQPASQWALGWSPYPGVQTGLAQIFIPKRITLTRIHLGYQYEFGGNP